MSPIQVVATFHVPAASLEGFKRAAAERLKPVKDEAGTLQYDWYFDEAERVCVVRETYTDSAALFAHGKTGGEASKELGEFSTDRRIELFGDVPADVREALSAHNPVYYSYFQGK